MTGDPPPAADVVRTEIVVLGRFGPALSSALGAYFVEVAPGPGRTRLVADVPDQPTLLGLLEVLAALNVHIVSVNPLDGAGALSPVAADADRSDR